MSAAPRESGTAESPHCGGSTELPHPQPRPLQPTPSLATWASFSRALRACHSENTTNTHLNRLGKWGWWGGMTLS